MKITKFDLKQNLNIKHRKNKYFTDEYSVFNLDKTVPEIILIVRFYHTPKQAYCCIWSNINDFRGSGYVGGYGYHRESAALYEALNACGIEFEQDISGRGSSQYESIFTSIANKLGYSNIFIHHSHS